MLDFDLMMDFPHIVKFSGGRSSGMMLMNLLEQNKLNPERGDVVLFNNTSAEHSATYEFVRKMKKLTEEKYNIPFFWIEYQTYEDASPSHSWVRMPTYRLVNEKPYSKKNPSGYHHRGEVFEEVISLSGYLPSALSRTCTHAMKIFITNNFLADWFSQKKSIERLGHYGDSARITDDSVIETHKKNGGAVPKNILLAKKEFVRGRPFIRQEQHFSDFTGARICFDNEQIRESTLGDEAQLYGDLAVEYVSYLGIRSDEQRRIVKIQDRIDKAQNKSGRSFFSQPHGEKILAPLIDENITREAVIEFWEKQDFDLDLPKTGIFSNCVFCPLKGKAKLLQLVIEELKRNSSNGTRPTPESIEWWIEIEEKYSRDLEAEKRVITSDKTPKYVGFFGATMELIYVKLRQQAVDGSKIDKELLEQETSLPCDCMD